jgi:small subunit ribosomal protein S12
MLRSFTRVAFSPSCNITQWSRISFVTKPLFSVHTSTIRNFSISTPLLQPTVRQLTRKPRKARPKKCLTKKLDHCPQKKATVLKVLEVTPKKPNSAKRKCVRVRTSNGHILTAHLPGVGHTLQPHSIVLVRGGRCQDLIGVRYKPIRGKYDFGPVVGRTTRKSKYGVKSKG